MAYVFTPIVSIVLLSGSSKASPFLRRHAAQGLLWSIPLLIFLIATVVLTIAMLRSTLLALCLLPILTVLPFVPGAFIGWRVYHGRDVQIPLISPLAERLFPNRRF